MKEILKLENYSVSFNTPKGEVEAVRNINLTVNKGEILCIVGESGCGKTVTCQSVMKLLPKNSKIKSGRIILDGEDITDYKEAKMRKLRGGRMSMIFQDPLLTLNPTMPVGKQITESIIRQQKKDRETAEKMAIELLNLVGIDNPEEMYHLQPHFFSGGMRQRCVIAVALAANPKILFADEPTTALDVTVADKILDLLIDIKNLFTVYRRSITVVMSSTEKSSCPIRVHTENFLVFICHPFRSGSGWCGKDRINAFFIQIVNYRFQPVKVIFPFFRLQYSPGKHPHGNRVDMCFLKIFDIFFQNVRSVQPLLRVVIATVQEMVISDLLCHFFFLLIFFIMTLYKKDAV